MWDLLTTFMGRARSTITLELCCFKAVTALIQNPHQIFCSRSHIIFSRKCPTSLRMWDLLTTFMGRARSTITLELCCFRAVTALIQNPHQIFCSRSHVIFSRKCPTSVRMWDLLTTFMGRARSTVTLESCCFRAVTTITRNPHQIFCSRPPVKLSRQCPTSVCRWEVVTTFVG